MSNTKTHDLQSIPWLMDQITSLPELEFVPPQSGIFNDVRQLLTILQAMEDYGMDTSYGGPEVILCIHNVASACSSLPSTLDESVLSEHPIGKHISRFDFTMPFSWNLAHNKDFQSWALHGDYLPIVTHIQLPNISLRVDSLIPLYEWLTRHIFLLESRLPAIPTDVLMSCFSDILFSNIQASVIAEYIRSMTESEREYLLKHMLPAVSYLHVLRNGYVSREVNLTEKIQAIYDNGFPETSLPVIRYAAISTMTWLSDTEQREFLEDILPIPAEMSARAREFLFRGYPTAKKEEDSLSSFYGILRLPDIEYTAATELSKSGVPLDTILQAMSH